MSTTTADWLGNHVQLEHIESTDLTLVQWHRPRHGSWRGAHVLDAAELREVRAVIDELDRLRRVPSVGAGRPAEEHRDAREAARFVREDLAGSPLHLESLLEDLLER